MDGEHELLRDLIIKQGETSAAQLKGVMLQVTAGFDAAIANHNHIKEEIVSIRLELGEYKDAKKEQNGRVDKLEKLTYILKLVKENPAKAAIASLIAYFGLTKLFTYISIAELIKKAL